MTLTDELRKLVGTSDVEPVLWQMEDRELTNLSTRVLLVRDAKRRLAPLPLVHWGSLGQLFDRRG